MSIHLPLADVPPSYTDSINRSSFLGARSPQDMICFIKKYISDSTLAQPPLLVMTHGRSSTFNLVPDLKILAFILAKLLVRFDHEMLYAF